MAETITVTVLKWHTRGGIVQPVGHAYEATADEVENLVAQGFVIVSPAAAAPAPKPRTPRREYTTTEIVKKRKTSLTATRKTLGP